MKDVYLLIKSRNKKTMIINELLKFDFVELKVRKWFSNHRCIRWTL